MSAATLAVVVFYVASFGALLYYVCWRLPARAAGRLLETMQVFATAVELRFRLHLGLTHRVTALSLAVGRRLMLSRSQQQRIEIAAHLRDIGLCSMPYRLGKTNPLAWTDAEKATYERHPEVGGAMLELIPSLRHMANIIRCHHARFDGAGGTFFPAQHDIPVESRILHVVSTFVWDEKLFGPTIALDTLLRGSGSEFDPVGVDAFCAVLRSARAAEGQPIAEPRL